MSNQYWILYEMGAFDADGPYGDIHACRNLAVEDASAQDCRVQIHRGDINFCEWNGETLVEEW